MDASSSSPAPSRELAALRRRAYGPDADIAGDPEAQRRLQELEELARAADTVEPAPAVANASEPVTAQTAGAVATAATPPTQPSEDSDAVGTAPQSPRKWWRRMPPWAPLVALGLVVVLLGLVLPMAWSPRTDASLAPLADQENGREDQWVQGLKQWLGIDGEMVEHEAFHHLRPFSSVSRNGGRCLVVAWDQPDTWADARCTPDGLAPIVDFMVTSDALQPLDEPLPQGSVVRFTLRDGVVDVTVSEAPATQTREP